MNSLGGAWAVPVLCEMDLSEAQEVSQEQVNQDLGRPGDEDLLSVWMDWLVMHGLNRKPCWTLAWDQHSIPFISLEIALMKWRVMNCY